MSSSATATAAADGARPPPEVSVHDDVNDEEHRSADQYNEDFVEDFVENSVEGDLDDEESSSALRSSVILTKIDLLGFGNGNGNGSSGTAVEGGATYATTGRKSAEISPNRRSGGESYRYEEVYDDLAPDLLSKNGRPRFDLVTVRENGRLRMFMVPNRWPQLVRSPLRDGRLRMWLLDDDDDDEQRGGGGGREQVSPPYDGGQ